MRTLKSKLLPTMMIASILSFSAVAFVPAAVAAPQTFVVNSVGNTDDINNGDGICDDGDGNCTLLGAIKEANATSDLDTIEFNIAGSGVHTIALPNNTAYITAPVFIDGYSQPGSVVNTAVAPLPLNNTIKIEIDTTQNVGGLVFDSASAGSTLRGVAIYGASDKSIKAGADNINIIGNYIGTDATGLSDAHYPIWNSIETGAGVDDLHLGGSNPADRNVIAGGKAITVDGANLRVYGNYIGIGKDGLTPLTTVQTAGATNIVLNNTSTNAIIGGPNAGEANVVSANTIAQISILASRNIVQGNLIGTDYLGNTHSSFGRGTGISIAGAANSNLIGGTNPGEGNIIAGTGGTGIGVFAFDIPLYSMTLTPDKNAILGNSISNVGIFDYLGFGNTNLGLDLLMGHYVGAPGGVPESFSLGGPNPNDDDDADTGANGFMNTPVLNSAVQTGDQLSVNYDLVAADSPSGTYRIEFFANDEATIFGYGPGQYYLGSVITTNGIANVANITLPNSDSLYGKALSATTTAIDNTTASGFGSTSEFAKNVQIGSAEDFDSDGVPDVIENAGANNGDGNADGIADYLQSRVSSYAVGDKHITFVTSGDGCAANGSVVPEQATTTDTGYAYPYGLTDFTLNCTVGGEAQITKYVFDDNNDAITDYSVRKYRPATHTYEPVAGSTVERVTIGGETALKLQYSIVEGEGLDDDGVANGIIVDPVGLAHVFTESQVIQTPTTAAPASAAQGNDTTKSASGTLSSTGANSSSLFNIAIATLMAGLSIALILRAKGRKSRA